MGKKTKKKKHKMDISIIIPAHNEEDYIEKTMECINVDGIEIIVVCNGCTDKTYNVARSYVRKNKKDIKVFRLKEKGVSLARNYGAKKAKKSKLVFLDADMKIWHDVLEKIDKTKYSVGTCYAKPDIDKFRARFLMKLKNKTHRFGTCTGLIFCDRDLFETTGGFDEKMHVGEDGKFLRHAKRAGNYGVVKGHVYNNMRRFENRGYGKVCKFWIKHFFNPKHQEYEVVR